MSAPLDRLHLLYHELRTTPGTYSYAVERSEFEKQMDLFVKARTSLTPSFWPEITFDDGHLSNYEFALPALAARGLQATFFITVGWTATRAGYMGWQELRALHAAGQQIGAHGWTHTLLTHCTDDDLRLELAEARTTLEDKLGTAITSMSLPGGRYDRRILAACNEAGYRQVYSSIPKPAPRSEIEASPTLIGRLNVRSGHDLAWFSRLLDPNSGVLAKLERQDRWKTMLKKTLGDQRYAKLWAVLNRHETLPEQSETAGT